MTDWSGDLNAALAAGDPAFMKAMLGQVPKEILQRAIPYLEVMAKNSVTEGKPDEALTYYSQLIEVAPGNIEWHASRAQVFFKLDQLQDAMPDVKRIIELNPELTLGYRLQAEIHDGLRERQLAVAAYQRVLQQEPNDEKSKQRIQFLESELRKEALLKQTLNPGATSESLQIELPPPPEATFDPALFNDPTIPETFDKAMVAGLKQHLSRYSEHQSSKNILARLEDPEWTNAWDVALSSTTDSTVLLHGSELGVFAALSRRHHATRVLAVERFPMDGRIAGGIVQKHLLTEWHSLHGSAIQSWSEDERRASFETFAKDIEIISPESEEFGKAHCDYFVFPNIDHSLLGTGIAKAIRQFRSRASSANARILPAKAKLFAMAIQWTYPTSPLELQPMNEFRWSLYPQALDIPERYWTALSESIPIGEIDFENFNESQWDIQLPIASQGKVDAIVFWYELEIGEARINNAPGSKLQCIKPGLQYADSLPVEPGQFLSLRIHVKETRLYFETLPAPYKIRSRQLPSWYIPMLLDQRRNDSFRMTLDRYIKDHASMSVLDIGAGCGLLSMMAAQAGASRVIGSEVSPAISKIGTEIVQLNGLEDKVTLINKDVRKMTLPDDLPERADLAVFELFDCSLIGEGILHFLAYAREQLLKENARYLPLAGRIRAMVIEYRLDRVLDIDVNLLNPYRFSQSFINVDANAVKHRVLTEPFDVFSFDFASATPTPEEKELLLPSIVDGTAGAVLFWFELQLGESTWLSNAPNAPEALHWKQGLQFMPEVTISAGSQFPVVAKHNGSGLTFQWKTDALPKEAFSVLPRFDPRWWQHSKELEQQTQGLLQHCFQNADEFKKVVEVAKRFAIDPAAYDLDPIIAQRFASTFFGT
jgi:predicted RNA methylase